MTNNSIFSLSFFCRVFPLALFFSGIGGNMDWIVFLDLFLDQFFRPFIFWDHFKGGGTPLVLRGGGMKSISTEGGVGDRVLLPREGDRRTITTQGRVGGGCYRKHYWFNWFFDWIFVCLNISAGPRRFFIFSVMRKRNCHVNTGLYVLPTENIGKQQ